MRTYFHLDMDAFFVSVEELFDPSLKGKPVVVGGKADERGVVSAASYAARKFGVHSAMPLRTAYKLCPQAIFVEGHRDRYMDYSGRVYKILQSFSPRVEMASIDEAYLDLTGTERLHGPPLRAAHRLHALVKQATDLNCSIGIATSRMVAKVASDQAKPNGVLWIVPGQEAQFLAPLDVRKIPGVGKVTEKNLHDCGIRKVGDLAALDDEFLESSVRKMGPALAGKVARAGCGRMVRWRSRRRQRSQIHQPRTYVFGGHRRSGKTRRDAGRGCRRWSRAGCGIIRCTPARCRSSCATPIFPRSRARGRWITPRRSIPSWRRRCGICFTKRGRAARSGCWAYTRSRWNRAKGRRRCSRKAKTERWRKTLPAVDKIRDKYGDSTVSLASGMTAAFRARVHENPENLPGKEPKNS